MLYSFTGGADGGWPLGGVILDSAGNLYGITASGSFGNFGLVYKLDTARLKLAADRFLDLTETMAVYLKQHQLTPPPKR